MKHLRNAALGMLFILAGIVIHASMQRTRPGEYGRLFDRQLPQPPVTTTHRVEVVTEAPAVREGTTSVDPILTAPVAQEEATVATTAAVPVAAGDRVAIVGDESGVTIVRHTAKLRGGFGRQP
jgi:hypothetical protein